MTAPPDLFAERYKIEMLLGRGTFGTVQRAFDTRLKRTVALKVPHRLLASDQEFLETFVQEAQTAAALSHPNIVTIYDVGEAADQLPYLAMRFLEGTSLRDLLEQEKLQRLDRALKILDQLASALDYLQDRRLVHRDIKPANIMIGADDEATVMDFGLARVLSGTHLSLSGVLAFTPLYASPEQIIGDRLTPASDRYSLAVIAYEMLAGRTPHAAFDTQVLLHAIRFEEPPSPEDVNQALPPAVGRVLRKALSKRPEDRPESARFLIRDIRAALESRLAYLSRTEFQIAPSSVPSETPSETPVASPELVEQAGRAVASPSELQQPSNFQSESPPQAEVQPQPAAAAIAHAEEQSQPASTAPPEIEEQPGLAGAPPSEPAKQPSPASAPADITPTSPPVSSASAAQPEGVSAAKADTKPLWTPPAPARAPEVRKEPAASPIRHIDSPAPPVHIPNELQLYAQAGINRVAVFGRNPDVCPFCAAVRKGSYPLEAAPELPLRGCTSTWGCHCEYVPIIDEGHELPENILAMLNPGQRQYVQLLELQRACARGDAEKIEVIVEPAACAACETVAGIYDPANAPGLPVATCRRYPPCSAEYRLYQPPSPQAGAATFNEMLRRFITFLQGKR